MEIFNERQKIGKNSSLGVLTFENEYPMCFVIEDGYKAIKVKGETRIPAGRYKLGIRKEETPLTLKSRSRPSYSGWFRFFIEVLDVPDFTNIYFHIGNTEKDTEGCQLLNYSCRLSHGSLAGSESQPAVKYFYERIYNRLNNGEEIFYNVIDL
jgi:hypothetical protein